MSDTDKDKLQIRTALISDARDIHALINKFASKNSMLPRALNDIYENIRDFVVCTNRNKVVGVAALHILWEDLAEVRSIAIATRQQKKGIGKRLVKYCLRQAGSLGIRKVFVLTYFPEFFNKLGFEQIDKNDLPHKIWGDCLKCPKFPDCTEEAMIKTLEI